MRSVQKTEALVWGYYNCTLFPGDKGFGESSEFDQHWLYINYIIIITNITGTADKIGFALYMSSKILWNQRGVVQLFSKLGCEYDVI